MRGEKQSKYITWNGRTQNMSAWAREFGMSLPCFRNRYASWNGNMDKIANTPVVKQSKTYMNGKRISYREIAERNGHISERTVERLLASGMPIEDIIMYSKKRIDTNNYFGKKSEKPDRCTHPDCDACPYDDCKW